jgi:hypothetical protein
MDKNRFVIFYYKYGWVGGLLGALGILYLGSPDDVQVSMRRMAPEAVRAGFIGVMPISNWVVLQYIATAFFACWGATSCFLKSMELKSQRSSLIEENEGLRVKVDAVVIDCYEFFSRYLVGYYSKLKLGADERVSLYFYDSSRFICIGIYSSNEVFRRKPSRIYGMHQGCIAKTWQRNKFQDSDAPDPELDIGKYISYQQENYGYEKKQLCDMQMKSRSYSGIRIKNPRSEAIAVLIFESTKPSGLPIGKIDRLIDLDEQRRLGALIDALEGHMPSLSDAEQEGF